MEGNLNLSSSLPPLIDVPAEVFELDKHIEQDEKFWEIVPLLNLDLSFNKITSLNELVGNLVDCISFKIRNNSLTTIPESFYRGCISLRHVDFDNNRLSEVSESVRSLGNLKEFIVSNNQLRSVPTALFQILSLQHLELQNNQLVSFPSSTWSTPSLLHLNVANNRIAQLPACIGGLRTLEVLFCQSNNLSSLPDLSQLSSLKFLDASQNQLTDFPRLPVPRKGGRSQLVQLFVGYNRIDRLHMEGLLAQCASLCELLVHNNQLTELPAELELLAQLKILDASNNAVRELPAGLGYMASLQRLKVDGNPIKSIRQLLLSKPTNELKTYLRTRGPSLCCPDGGSEGGKDSGLDGQVQFRMRDITAGVLDLSGLDLTGVSAQWVADLRQLPAFASLHSLDLSRNSLCEVPSVLRELTAVKVLLLANNTLCHGSSGGSAGGGEALRAVASLDVSQNRLSAEAFEALLLQANRHTLTELAANNNSLGRLPPHLSRMTALRSLRLCGCQIATLRDLDLRALQQLETLDVSCNKLEELPDALLSPGCALE